MKKSLALLPIFLFLPLSSCGNIDSVTPVSLDKGTLIGMDAKFDGYSHTTRIDYTELEALVNNKKNFLLLAHSSSRIGCTCFSEWHNDIFAPYVKKHNLLVYLIEMSELTGEGRSNYGLKLNAEYATLGIFKDGKVAYQHGTSDERDPWVTTSSEFAAWMNYRISYPSLLLIDKDQLDSYYEGGNPFSIYFSRGSCGDCSYFENNYLKEYLSANKTEYLYCLDCDCDGIRFVIGEDGVTYSPKNVEGANEYELEAYAQWNKFKEDYGLSYSLDNPAGWDSGYVPTVYHINPDASGSGRKIGDVIDGAMVIYNDSFDNGVISSTYFTKERLAIEALSYLKESKEIKEEDKVLLGKPVGEKGDRSTGLWRHEESAKYHNPIAKAFFDAFIKREA